MKPQASPSKAQNHIGDRRRSSPHKYTKVLDGRKQPIRGLWKRNGSFIARFTEVDKQTGRKIRRWVPLDKADSPATAKAALDALLVARAKDELPVLGRTPKFNEYVASYLKWLDSVPDAKRPKTVATEKVYLGGWVKHLGEIRLDKITLTMIRDYVAKRQMAGRSARTVNLGVTCLRNVLKRAVDDGYLRRLPTENLHPLKYTPKRRPLVSLADINALCEAAIRSTKNAEQFSDFIRLLAFCGARRDEALALKWVDVDWETEQLTIGANETTKNHQIRRVDFNAELKAHLLDMSERRQPDSEWIFPSPQRGELDIHARSFTESLRLARKGAELPQMTFHVLRHFFVSFCVMSKIDFSTIAKWVGHSDGGILIGKVYGHLASEHTKAQAQRVRFEPVVMEKEA